MCYMHPLPNAINYTAYYYKLRNRLISYNIIIVHCNFETAHFNFDLYTPKCSK